MSYVYQRTDQQCWTVGHYDPSGGWHTDSDHDTKEAAAARVAFLNGSGGGQSKAAARSEVAVAALQGLLAGPAGKAGLTKHQAVSQAVEYADLLLAELARKPAG